MHQQTPQQLLSGIFLSILLFAISPLVAQEQSFQKSPLSLKMQQLTETLPAGEMVDVLIKGDPDEITTYLENNGGRYKYAAGHVVAARIPAGKAENTKQYQKIERIDPVWGKIVPLDNEVDSQNNIWQVRSGQAPLSQEYTGKGVVIGFLDTGIELDHPDFWNSDSTTRVKYIWDQTKDGGAQTPVQFGYGYECDSSDINAGNCEHRDNNSHGTKVAGLAAGNGNTDSNFTGVAPESDIVIVKVDLNHSFLTKVVDGVNYILKKAEALGKPVVINASLGTYVGSHDGKDLAAKAIDYMLQEQPGRMMVCAAGNEGDVPFHLGYDVTSDTNFTWFRYNSNLGATYFELWADTADFNEVNFQLSADNPTDYCNCYSGKFFNVQEDFNLDPGIGVMKDSIISPAGECIGVASYYVELVDDRYVMDIVIQPDSTGYLFRFATTGSGHFDVWSHPSITGTSRMVTQVPTITEYPNIKHYKFPDHEQTMVSSWACSPNVLTVGSYVSRESYTAYNGQTVNQNGTKGDMEPTSSLGPTRTGHIKPDLITNGQNALTTLPLWQRNGYLNNNPTRLASSGWHARFGGTSSSSPIVAGAVALYLQQNPQASTEEIVKVFTETAYQDSFTAKVSAYKAGHGKLDVYAALTAPRGCTDPDATNYEPNAIIDDGSCQYDTVAAVRPTIEKAPSVSLYPNPVGTDDLLRAKIGQVESKGTIAIFNMEGRQMIRENFNANDRTLKFDVGHWPGGVYLVQVFTTHGQWQSKVIKP